MEKEKNNQFLLPRNDILSISNFDNSDNNIPFVIASADVLHTLT